VDDGGVKDDLCLVSRRLQLATFGVIVATFFIVSLHLVADWKYKAKWKDLTVRVEKLESDHSNK